MVNRFERTSSELVTEETYKLEGADQDVARALELAPKDADALLTVAAFAIERNDLDLARRHLTIGSGARSSKLADVGCNGLDRETIGKAQRC